LSGRAIAEIHAAFELEHGLSAAAQIFDAAHAPAAARRIAARQFVHVFRRDIARVVDAFVEHAV
jgi:hypothetical protein